MQIRIGPVASNPARVWTAHLLHNLAVVRARRAELPFRFPDDVAATFERLLTEWHELASTSSTFEWQATFDDDHVKHLVRYWANLDALTDGQIARLGIVWSPPEAKPFFDALVVGVADGFAQIGEADSFVGLLARDTPLDELSH